MVSKSRFLKAILLLAAAVSVALGDVRVAAAANVGFVLPKLIEAFNARHPEIKVTTTIGSSGKLYAQIAHGAGYDLYLSANYDYPKRLFEEGRSYTRPVVYALGRLVVVGKKPLDSLEDLTTLGRIAIANPKSAPYGAAAKEALIRAGLYERLEPRLIYGESIAQTVGYARHGADAAIVALSALKSGKLAGLKATEVDPKLYTPIRQGMVLVRPGAEAERFFAFLLSREAAAIFKEYGYGVPE